MDKHTLKIEPGSEAEQYFISEIQPKCKDEVVCRLGSVFGWSWNEYDISVDDYDRIRTYIVERDRG